MQPQPFQPNDYDYGPPGSHASPEQVARRHEMHRMASLQRMAENSQIVSLAAQKGAAAAVKIEFLTGIARKAIRDVSDIEAEIDARATGNPALEYTLRHIEVDLVESVSHIMRTYGQ